MVLSLIAVWWPPMVVAQQPVEKPRRPNLIQSTRGSAPEPRAADVLIEPAAPIANLFARASDGIERADWKFAIDCLQRIIDDPAGALMPRPDGATGGSVLYETARRQAIRRLASLPPEGQRAYRLLYDGKAKRLFSRGASSHDPKPLRIVVNRYILSRYGAKAADLLASWALDAGRAGEVVVLLTDYLGLEVGGDAPDPKMVAKLAAAYAMLGRPEEAAGVLATYARASAERSEPAKDGNPLLSADNLSRLKAGDSDWFPSAGGAGTPTAGQSWPVAGGSLNRQGRMPFVKPALVRDVPWRFELPGGVAGAWRRVFADSAEEPLWLPVSRLVAWNRVLFARTRTGFVALDRDDLRLRYESLEPGLRGTGGGTGSSDAARRSLAGAGSVADGLTDYVTGAISLAHGLVTIISRSGRSDYEYAGRDGPAASAAATLLAPAPGSAGNRVEGTRLLAYDAETGRLQWQRGRTGHPGDPLGDVTFRSVGLAVDHELWTVFLRQRDLYVAVLDPDSGALIRSILLGSIRGFSLEPSLTLPPALTDGVVYVPSGSGVLFAIDASDSTVRWANQYLTGVDRAVSRRGGGRTGGFHDSWLPAAPVVSGGLVVLAPVESQELLAFSAATGELRWSVPRGDWAYIVAADVDRVWLGGRSVCCLSLVDGTQLWSVALPSTPTGRAVLSGDVLYVPVLRGLLSLDAAAGETMDYALLPAPDEPLGNLLALDGSLYVVNPSSVRQYPDLEQQLARTQARYAADPADPAPAIHLAWLSLLKGEPDRSLQVLEAIPPGTLSDDPRRAAEVSRVRVSALMARADRITATGDGGGKALALLEQAHRTALSATDRLRTGLAIADRLAAMKRRDEALKQLWELGLSPDADEIVPWDEHVRGRARIQIARRLREIEAPLSQRQRRELHEAFRAGVGAFRLPSRSPSAARAAAAQLRPKLRARLRALVDLDPKSAGTQRALMALAADDIRSARYEPAEVLLRACIRINAEPRWTIAGLVNLGRSYAAETAGGLDCTGPLLRTLAELGSRFAAVPLPDAVVAEIEREPPPAQAGATPSVADWVRRTRDTIPARVRAAFDQAFSDAPVQLTGESAWSIHWDPRSPPQRLVRFASSSHPGGLSARAGIPDGRVFLYGPDDVVSCYDARKGELLWEASLRLPEQFTREGVRDGASGRSLRRRGVAYGQTAVFSATDGLFAVGLTTGRRLWYRAYELAGESADRRNRDLLMAAGDGLVAASPKAGRLTLMRILDGSTVWERDLRAKPVDRIWMLGDRVVTADQRLERVNLFDRATGTLIQRVSFDQPDRTGRPIALVPTGGVLCGPVSTPSFEGVTGIDLAGGQPAWEMALDKPLVALFEAQKGYLGIGLLGGDVRIVEAATGEALPSRHVSGTQKVLGGVLVDGTLVVQHSSSRESSDFHKLAALDIVTGEELWRRDDVISLSPSWEPLRVVGGAAVAIVVPPRDRQRKRPWYVTLIDVRSGEDVGVRAAPGQGKGAVRFLGDFEADPGSGVLVVGTETAIHALRIEPVEGEPGRGL